jgi:hypothetical protein
LTELKVVPELSLKTRHAQKLLNLRFLHPRFRKRKGTNFEEVYLEEKSSFWVRFYFLLFKELEKSSALDKSSFPSLCFT